MLRGEPTIHPLILSQRLDIRFPNRISKGILHEPGFFIPFSVYFELVVGSRSSGRIGGLATHYSVVWTAGLWVGKTLWTPTGRCIGCNARNVHGSVATACPIRFGKNGGQLSRMASHGLSEQGYRFIPESIESIGRMWWINTSIYNALDPNACFRVRPRTRRCF